MAQLSDNTIMNQVKSGDTEKLGLLFERYNRALFSYFMQMTGCRQTSEDLVQNVFIRILKYRNTYKDEGAFSTWVYRIARNTHIDYCRKQKRSVEVDEITEPDQLEGENSNDNRDYASDHRLNLVKKALEQLDTDKKEVLILSRYQGFKYHEIAVILECSVSAVKVRVFRALNEMRLLISKMEKEFDYDR